MDPQARARLWPRSCSATAQGAALSVVRGSKDARSRRIIYNSSIRRISVQPGVREEFSIMKCSINMVLIAILGAAHDRQPRHLRSASSGRGRRRAQGCAVDRRSAPLARGRRASRTLAGNRYRHNCYISPPDLHFKNMCRPNRQFGRSSNSVVLLIKNPGWYRCSPSLCPEAQVSGYTDRS